MIKFILERPVAVLTTLFALLVLGIASIFYLPVSLMPNVQIPEISIYYSYDHLSVDEVENSVTSRLRGALQQIPGVDDIVTESEAGRGAIKLRFDFGASLDYAFVEVNQRIDQVMSGLPKELARPHIIKASTSDIPVFYINTRFVGVESDIRFMEFCNFLDAILIKRLEQLPEVAMVDVTGVYNGEIYIQPDETKLKAMNINLDQLSRVIGEHNSIVGSLSIRDGYYQYNVKFNSHLQDQDEIGDIYLNINGKLLQIKDIAEVGIRPRNKLGLFKMEAGQAISLAVVKQADARMSDMKREIDFLLSEFKDDYPEIEFSISRDQAELLDYSISNLRDSLILGVVLAIFVMFFFLQDGRSPLIIAISIPLSILISLLFFNLIGLSINTISLSGLILGVGMMVDNSIIVIDNINQHRRRGSTLFEACLNGTNEIVRPLLSSVLTTCVVFIPLIFLSGVAGALFYDQAIAVTIGLFVSLVVSITVVPVVFQLLFKNAKDGAFTRFIRLITWKNPEHYYSLGYHYVFSHRKLVMLFSVLLLFLGAGAAYMLPMTHMPELSKNEALLFVDWNSSIHLDENQRRCDIFIDRYDKQCLELNCCIGEKQYLLERGSKQRATEAEFYLRCDDENQLNQTLDSITIGIKSQFPDALIEKRNVQNLFEQIFQDEGAPLVVHLNDQDSRKLLSYERVTEFVSKLSDTIPGMTINLPAIGEQLVLNFNVDRMVLYGVSHGNLINQLKKSIHKMEIGRLNNGNEYLPMVLTEEPKTIYQVLKEVEVSGVNNTRYPISYFIELSYETNYKQVFGYKGGTSIPLALDISSKEIPVAIEKIEAVAKSSDMDVSFTGSYFAGKETFWQMMLIALIAISLLYFVLASQFESLKMPLVILIEIPVDIALTMIVMWATGTSLNMMSMIGIVVMCGIVINDSILKIDTILRLEKDGYSLLEAIHEGGIRRLKPILMTSLTTIMALVPIFWGDDLGSQLQRPLAITLVAGMGIGTLISLYWIPLCYYYIRRIGRKS